MLTVQFFIISQTMIKLYGVLLTSRVSTRHGGCDRLIQEYYT